MKKCDMTGCKRKAVYRVKTRDGIKLDVCEEHAKGWNYVSCISLKRRARNIRCIVSLVLLLVLSGSYGAYLATASKAPVLKPGYYLTVKPISLEETPDPSEYIVLNYTHKSEINEYDLVYVLDNFDQIKADLKEAYEQGKISELEYQLFLERGWWGRVIEKVKALLTEETKYILWQPKNRWFIITDRYWIDTADFPDPMINQVKGAYTTILAVGWIAWIAYTVKTRKES